MTDTSRDSDRTDDNAPAAPVDSLGAIVPLVLVLTICVLSLAALFVAAHFSHVELAFVKKHSLGMDYSQYYKATKQYWSGRSPYNAKWFVTPPTFVLFNKPLLTWPLAKAAKVIFCLSYFTIGCGMGFAAKSLLRLRGKQWALYAVLALGFMAVSYPMYFVANRGNIDGIVVFLIWAGALIGLRGRFPIAGGVLIGLAAAFKLYPCGLLLPLIVTRRWRVLTGMVVALLLAIAEQPRAWTLYVHGRLFERAGAFVLGENASVASVLYSFAALCHLDVSNRTITRIAIVVTALCIAALAWFQFRASRRGKPIDPVIAVAMYLPFFVAVPGTSYAYQLVQLIPLVALLGRFWIDDSLAGRSRIGVVVASTGLAVSQLHVMGYSTLLQNYVADDQIHFVCGIGLMIVMGAFVARAARPLATA